MTDVPTPASSTAPSDPPEPSDPSPAAGRTPVAGRTPQHWWRTDRLPKALLGLLFTLLTVWVCTRSGAYGRTWDEELEDIFGRAILDWYTSGGREAAFMHWPPELQMPQHGPLFEGLVAAAQAVTGEQWTTRAVMTGLAALLGILAVALCGRELGGWWLALLSAVGLTLYPRYLGAMFNNPKDIPLATAMSVVLWLALRLVRRWPAPGGPPLNPAYGRALVDVALVGAAIGAAMAVRVLAVVWYGLLGMLLLGWWLRHGLDLWRQRRWLAELGRQALAGVVLLLVSFVTVCLCWPYILMDPLPHLLDSFHSMAKYPWTGWIPFGDQHYWSYDLPRRYTLQWLLIGSPLPVAVLGGVGTLVALVHLLRVRSGDARVAAVGLSFLLPVTIFVVMRPTMYNAMRHFLFLVPSLVLLAAYTLVRSWSWLRTLPALSTTGRRVAAAALVAVVALVQAEAVVTTARISPYEYAYFNPLVGGLPGAAGRYEIDYWGTCNRDAARWLLANQPRVLPTEPGRRVRLETSVPGFLATTYLPRERYESVPDDPDIFIWSVREFMPDRHPDFRVVHEVRVQGYPICVVKVRADQRRMVAGRPD